ncbi:MAG: hypothetical protein AB1529_08390 [Candidatus Micrarchaeota archaeon]
MGLGNVPAAMGRVFGAARYLLLALFLSISSFFLYVSLPVYSVPGNSYGFFFAATPPAELAAMAGLSLIMGIVFSMQIYAWRRGVKAVENAGIGFAGFISGALSGLFASATCASCISALFSFLSFSGVLFLLEHRFEISVITAVVALSSLYLTAQRIEGACASCALQPGKDVKGGKQGEARE